MQEIVPYTSDYFKEVIRLLESMEPWKSDAMSDDYYRSILDPEKNNIRIALDGKKLCGVVTWQTFDHYPYGGYLRILAVENSMKRQGLGSQLLKLAEENIFASLKNSYISVHETNKIARSFYKKHKYEEVGPLHDFVHKGHVMIMLRKTTGPLF
jgi:ribosomal protein S18 acetylase RimI-like enzyme